MILLYQLPTGRQLTTTDSPRPSSKRLSAAIDFLRDAFSHLRQSRRTKAAKRF
jgi:hypothetical protein